MTPLIIDGDGVALIPGDAVYVDRQGVHLSWSCYTRAQKRHAKRRKRAHARRVRRWCIEMASRYGSGVLRLHSPGGAGADAEAGALAACRVSRRLAFTLEPYMRRAMNGVYEVTAVGGDGETWQMTSEHREAAARKVRATLARNDTAWLDGIVEALAKEVGQHGRE